MTTSMIWMNWTTMSWMQAKKTRIRARRSIELALGVILVAAAPVWASAVETAAARAVMEETVSDVLAVLRAPELETPERRTRLETIARDRFDFETMSKLVLRRSWKKFSAQQRVDFVDAFTDHLATSYGTRVERYNEQDVQITGDRSEPRGDVTVLTTILGGGASDISMDYRLRAKEGIWRVIDVKIEGISLISSFRSQFKEVLSQNGPDEVLRRLKEKTATLENSGA
ncbi:MAG: ABC transporter substrate-binding protein [Deltaproteobacteria bacterium]|nr:ABC transporter substrate-binding protein [Deltaproteobacteria bacterium]